MNFSKFQSVIPTLKMIGLSDFIYLRVTRCSKFFVLSNNNWFVKDIIKAKLLNPSLKDLLLRSIPGKLCVVLFNDLSNKPGCRVDYAVLKAGIGIALPAKEYIDVFSFFSDPKNNHEDQFYLRHFGLLKRFIIFFRLNYKKEIEFAANNLLDLKEKIQLYSNCHKKTKKLVNLSLADVPIKPYLLAMNTNKIFLTDKEKFYLSGLLEGKSARIMAKELCISPRSIESSLEMLKAKTGYSTKSELLKAFIEGQYLNWFYYDRYY